MSVIFNTISILGRSGLTETELEDILSCDDDVLNDVYQYWTPPVRRLPALLVVRIKADLNHYLGMNILWLSFALSFIDILIT